MNIVDHQRAATESSASPPDEAVPAHPSYVPLVSDLAIPVVMLLFIGGGLLAVRWIDALRIWLLARWRAK